MTNNPLVVVNRLGLRRLAAEWNESVTTTNPKEPFKGKQMMASTNNAQDSAILGRNGKVVERLFVRQEATM
jgi:hypothetical protein